MSTAQTNALRFARLAVEVNATRPRARLVAGRPGGQIRTDAFFPPGRAQQEKTLWAARPFVSFRVPWHGDALPEVLSFHAIEVTRVAAEMMSPKADPATTVAVAAGELRQTPEGERRLPQGKSLSLLPEAATNPL